MTPEEKKKEDERLAQEKAEAEEKERLEKEGKEGLEIELDDEGKPKSDEQKKKDDEDAKAAAAEQHKRNAEAAQRRLDQDKQRLKKENEDYKRRIAELERNSTQRNFDPNQPVVKDSKYWEEYLAKDPVNALKEHYRFMRQQEIEQQRQYEGQQEIVNSFHKSLKDSESMAYDEFPELKDEGSEHYSMFMDILEKNPEWRNSPIGPIKVVNEMKKSLAKGDSGSNILNRAKSEGANSERERQARISNQPLSSTRETGAKKTFTLTKEQLEYCKENNIKPENYAKIAMRMSGGEGVTV